MKSDFPSHTLELYLQSQLQNTTSVNPNSQKNKKDTQRLNSYLQSSTRSQTQKSSYFERRQKNSKDEENKCEDIRFQEKGNGNAGISSKEDPYTLIVRTMFHSLLSIFRAKNADLMATGKVEKSTRKGRIKNEGN